VGCRGGTLLLRSIGRTALCPLKSLEMILN
jgi:hypothetical protein